MGGWEAPIVSLLNQVTTGLLLVGAVMLGLGLVIVFLMFATSIFDEALRHRAKGGLIVLLLTAAGMMSVKPITAALTAGIGG